MRIRLQVLLPLLLGLITAAGFVLVGLTVSGVVRGEVARGAEPGAAAVRVVALWGLVAVLGALVAGSALARMIVRPLGRMRENALRADTREGDTAVPAISTPLAEVQDASRGLARAGRELRAATQKALGERAELATLMDAVSEGILQLDGMGRVVRFNRAAGEMLRLPHDAEGRAVAALVRDRELRRLLERAVSGRGSTAAEVALDDRRVLVAVATLSEGGAVATLMDLTDLRRLEEVRRDFVANASHELKTPLTSIRGYTETLLDGDLPPTEHRQFLETIARNAERLQRTVDDLLDLSRLESGRWRPELAEVDVAALAEETWRPFAERADGAEVAFQVSAGDDPVAAADRRGLEQVFSNLYENAIRHAGGGRIVVRIRHHQGAETGEEMGARKDAGAGDAAPRVEPRTSRPIGAPTTGHWLAVEVADTGSGIPRDALPRIFERFYRVDPARSRAEGGTGLGLSIVKHMIESMGGTVTAESELGKGTTIRFWLPRT